MMIAKSGRDWQPPDVGTLYRRKDDGTIWEVAVVYRRDRMLKLVRTYDDESRARFVFAHQLVNYVPVV